MTKFKDKFLQFPFYDTYLDTINPQKLLLAVVLLSSALRIFNITKHSFSVDEAHYISRFARDFSSMIYITLHSYEGNPPQFLFFSFIMNLSSNVLGKSEFVLRFISLVFGVLNVFLMYHLARILCGARIGLLAALLMALSPLHIFHSQEVKAFAMSLFFTTASVILFLKVLEKPTKTVWRQFFIVTYINLHIYFTAFLNIIFQNLLIFMWNKKGIINAEFLKNWKQFHKILFLIYAIWIFNLLKVVGGMIASFLLTTFGVVTPGGFQANMSFLASMVNVFLSWNGIPELAGRAMISKLVIAIPFLIPFIIIFRTGFREIIKEKRKVQFLLFYMLLPLVLGYFLMQSGGGEARHFMLSSPAYYIFFVIGLLKILESDKFLISLLPYIKLYTRVTAVFRYKLELLNWDEETKILRIRMKKILIYCVLLVLILGPIINYAIKLPDWREAADKANRYIKLGDIVVCIYGRETFPFAHYFTSSERLINIFMISHHTKMPGRAAIKTLKLEGMTVDNAPPALIKKIAKKYKRLVVVSFTKIPGNYKRFPETLETEKWLYKNCKKISEEKVSKIIKIGVFGGCK